MLRGSGARAGEAASDVTVEAGAGGRSLAELVEDATLDGFVTIDLAADEGDDEGALVGKILGGRKQG